MCAPMLTSSIKTDSYFPSCMLATCSFRKLAPKMWIVQTSLCFSLLLTIHADQEENTCTEVQQKLQTLSESVQDLCVSLSPPAQQQCDCGHAVNWTSVSMTQIAYSQLRQTGTLVYDIPSVIPSSAEEVLLLASVAVGRTGPSNSWHHIKIYTQQDSQQYEKYLTIYTWPNKAHNTNSDNLWFPMTTDRQVFVELSVAHTGHLHFYLNAIGYR